MNKRTIHTKQKRQSDLNVTDRYAGYILLVITTDASSKKKPTRITALKDHMRCIGTSVLLEYRVKTHQAYRQHYVNYD